MTVRPILFSGPMVRALLEGRKTQTRRVLSWQPGDLDRPFMMDDGSWHITDSIGGNMSPLEVSYKTGDLLYVREAWYAAYSANNVPPRDMDPDWKICPAIDWNYADWGIKGRLRSGMHMPRWASRITLKVTDVRVQRLQEISEDDAKAEGIRPLPLQSETDPSAWWESDYGENQARTPVASFCKLWDSLNEKRGFGWDTNPWVIAVSFDVIKANVDTVLSEVAA